MLGYIHGQPYYTLYHAPLANVLALSVASGAQKGAVGRALLARLEDWRVKRVSPACGFPPEWNAQARIFFTSAVATAT